jgi:alkylation response protein AidB-like acyl-CoA dehydrogenase
MKRTIFDQDHQLFRDNARRFFTDEVAPRGADWRAQGHVDRSIYLAAARNGLLMIWAEEQYGGSGVRDLRYEQIVHEENVSHGEVGFFTSLHSMVVGPYLDRFATHEQKLRWLAPAARGEKILAIAMTEPAAGSDLAGMKTHAEDHGEYWLLNGAKTYISSGSQADFVVVAARTPGNSSHSMGLFVIETGMPGFTHGEPLKKMALHAQDTAELFFSDVRVPKSGVLGDATQGFKYMSQCLPIERLFVAIGSVAASESAFELTLEAVKQRRAFGKPIGAMQNTRFKMAEMRTRIDAAQCFVDQCVLLANAGELSASLASEAKLLATELEGWVLDECVQLHGGAGYMDASRICRMFGEARITRIYAGTSEIMKELIGRSLGLDERTLK